MQRQEKEYVASSKLSVRMATVFPMQKQNIATVLCCLVLPMQKQFKFICQIFHFAYKQGYHRSRIKNKDDWGKFYFRIQNETTFGDIPKNQHDMFLFARLTSDHIFVYLSLGTICFSNVLFLEKNSGISNSFVQSSRKTFFRLLVS